ncbi:DUF2244 domain-containing protein [Thalassorhabdomicrobium marinisediminis]|uniref:DUF2244 domain-containing protein n=1 Tax=Thalassorhabdomicrobium marinisediminis TaxID=2170577 RepID=UPI0024930216|nr:DUF2244 domain-containing protein [Thalassorhabdomicrobium marinisediminis]
MPYEWIAPDAGAPDAPLAELHLWPYRSLLRRDFVVFISATVTLIAVPLLVVIGSPVLWGLLPFFIIAVAGLWYGLHRSYKDGELLEVLRLWPDRITLQHHNPRRGDKSWEANPYWVRLKLDPTHDRVPNYITLKGADRVVELGAFLSEKERAALFDELDDALRRARGPQ